MIKMPRPRLLSFLLFHIPKPGMHVLLNPREIPIKELFFNKTSGLQPANAIKRSSSKKYFKDFGCFLRTANLKNNIFLLTR